MGGRVCKKVSKLSEFNLIAALANIVGNSAIFCFVLVAVLGARAARADIPLGDLGVSHYTETSWLPQYNDVVLSSKVKLDLFQSGPLHGYAGALLEQDTESNETTIYNDNGVSPLVGAWLPLIIPQLAFFTEYRQTFRMINRPDSRSPSQPDWLIGTYGYNFWSLASITQSTTFFQEMYGDLISRSKLAYDPMLESWSKTGARLALVSGFSLDGYLDLQFRRATTGEPEDNFQSFGPGVRLNYNTAKYGASLSAHQELGSYTNRSDAISRWKGLLVISGAF